MFLRLFPSAGFKPLTLPVGADCGVSGVQRASNVRRRPAAVLPGAPAARGKRPSSGGIVLEVSLNKTLLVFLPQLDEAAIGSQFQLKWFELQKLLERQRSKGGIIDPEEESNRFLIHINEVRIQRLHIVRVIYLLSYYYISIPYSILLIRLTPGQFLI